MTDFQLFAIIITAIAALNAYLFKKLYMPPDFTELDYLPSDEPEKEEVPKDTSEPVKPVLEAPSAPEKLLWATPKQAFHSTRVLCDEMGLTYEQKNIVCACIYQESAFNNKAVGKNTKSTDWGLVQVNDTPGWHIGPGLRFKSVQDVLDNPEKAVRWMILNMKKTGKLHLWASYSSGAYKKWLAVDSPMWKLKS